MSSDPSTAPVAAPECSGAELVLDDPTERRVLTAVAPAVTITSSSGGTLDAPLRPVRQYKAQVVSRSEVPQERVYQALLERLGETAPSIPLGESAPHDVSGDDTISGPGRFVRYEGVEAVEATFTLSCGRHTAQGVVSTWLVLTSGILSCDEPSSGAMAREAYAVGCRDTPQYDGRPPT